MSGQELNLIIQKAAAGDRDAFARLLELYEKQVYHHALRMVGNAEDAADVTQECFLKVWQGLPSFHGDSAFSTWLFRLTDNACIDLIRREKKRRGELSLDGEEQDYSAALADPAPTPQQALEQKELHRAVREGLAALSEEHRRVLILRELDGLSYEEIGDILGLTPGTVKSRIARARLALAKFLRKKGNFSGFDASI